MRPVTSKGAAALELGDGPDDDGSVALLGPSALDAPPRDELVSACEVTCPSEELDAGPALLVEDACAEDGGSAEELLPWTPDETSAEVATPEEDEDGGCSPEDGWEEVGSPEVGPEVESAPDVTTVEDPGDDEAPAELEADSPDVAVLEEVVRELAPASPGGGPASWTPPDEEEEPSLGLCG
jgi:hypothetical protein